MPEHTDPAHPDGMWERLALAELRRQPNGATARQIHELAETTSAMCGQAAPELPDVAAALWRLETASLAEPERWGSTCERVWHAKEAA